jgi:hypothetical protein
VLVCRAQKGTVGARRDSRPRGTQKRERPAIKPHGFDLSRPLWRWGGESPTLAQTCPQPYVSRETWESKDVVGNADDEGDLL